MNILDHFNPENVGSRIEDLETPVPLVDIGIVEHNLRKWQERSNKLGIANWPHIKTHKLVGLAKAQIELGARGITVQKLGEAEVMADAGITDMLLTFNVVGTHKLERLAAMAKARRHNLQFNPLFRRDDDRLANKGRGPHSIENHGITPIAVFHGAGHAIYVSICNYYVATSRVSTHPPHAPPAG